MDVRWISSLARSIARIRAASCGCVIGASSTWLMARRGRYTWCVPVLLFPGTRKEGMLMSRGAGGWSQRKCTRKHPPGRKVYQRGAHTIWEVDGAKEKVRTHWSPSGRQFYFLTLGEQLYCQNLSLFGKLFIDIKTLFFDCDNCERSSRPQTAGRCLCTRAVLFYIFTDADSQRDHVLGFFSKATHWTSSSPLSNLIFWQEKISYDDYNLACIVVLPPYQKKGYGMLLIEFSTRISPLFHGLGQPTV